MDLEEDDDGANGGGRGGVFPRLFYDEAGNEVEAGQGQRVMPLDPRERFMDRPDAAPEDFAFFQGRRPGRIKRLRHRRTDNLDEVRAVVAPG